MKLSEIKLGTTMTDIVTGLSGRVTAKIEYEHGMAQALLSALDTTGRPIEHWVVIDRLRAG